MTFQTANNPFGKGFAPDKIGRTEAVSGFFR
jgi:hypothetical protein